MESLYHIELKVRDYECDAQGIVNNANYQHFYEIARHEFLENNGMNFYQLHLDGIDAVVVSIHIKYKHSLRGGNSFICHINSIEREGIRLIFNQSITRTSDNKVCSTARIETACVINGKVSKPDIIANKLRHYIQ